MLLTVTASRCCDSNAARALRRHASFMTLMRTPIAVNTSRPKGGVSSPSCMQMRNITPNHTVSKW